MNARTKDGTIHALTRLVDLDGSRNVVCGLRGQAHEYAPGRPRKPNVEGIVEAIATTEPVTCLACLALEPEGKP